MPFADHNAMLDPDAARTSPAACSKRCARYGVPHRIIRPSSAASTICCARRKPDGSWYGRWGVNYIYGTWLALRGLRAAGEDDREAHVLRAGEWLRSIQNADGGWGESCASYDNDTFTPAPSTPSQTAWALLGLLAGGDTTSQQRAQRRRVPARNAARRRRLGRGTVHRHRLPAGVLPAVSPVPAFISRCWRWPRIGRCSAASNGSL